MSLTVFYVSWNSCTLSRLFKTDNYICEATEEVCFVTSAGMRSGPETFSFFIIPMTSLISSIVNEGGIFDSPALRLVVASFRE